MTDIVQLREPFRSFFKQLEECHVTVCRHNHGHIYIGNSWIMQIPTLDRDDARELSAELEAAIAPVIERFRKKKLDELFALMAGNAQPVLIIK